MDLAFKVGPRVLGREFDCTRPPGANFTATRSRTAGRLRRSAMLESRALLRAFGSGLFIRRAGALVQTSGRPPLPRDR